VPVATRVGGVPELITEGVDGYLEAPGDVDAQAAHVTELLTDEKLHRTMSRAARSTAVDNFCTEKIIPLYEQYYDEVVSGRSRILSAGSTWPAP
jgi:glycosyltransferase involved in cell wall biosynthesis